SVALDLIFGVGVGDLFLLEVAVVESRHRKRHLGQPLRGRKVTFLPFLDSLAHSNQRILGGDFESEVEGSAITECVNTRIPACACAHSEVAAAFAIDDLVALILNQNLIL